MKLGCLPNTRSGVFRKIEEWLEPSSEDGDLFWIYGDPGTGKSAVMHSFCQRMVSSVAKHRLGASFFCRRDDPDRRSAIRIIPTLAFQLAKVIPEYRKQLEEILQTGLNLRSLPLRQQFLKLFSEPLKLSGTPTEGNIAIVIDALDEFGTEDARQALLEEFSALTNVRPWLKIIIASRCESDIEASFSRLKLPPRKLELSPAESIDDITLLAKHRLAGIAEKAYLERDWPGDQRLRQLVDSADGRFIWMVTALNLLEDSLNDPDERIKSIIQTERRTTVSDIGLSPLYTTILSDNIGDDPHNITLFRNVIGSVIAVSLFQALSIDTLHCVMRDSPGLTVIENIVESLASVLDYSKGGPIQVRHISFFEFMTSEQCPEMYRVDLAAAHAELALSCLTIVNEKTSPSICELKDSLLANSQTKDLPEKIEQCVDSAFQYSCVNWENHLRNASWGTYQLEVRKELTKLASNGRCVYWLEVLSRLGEASTGTVALCTGC